MQEISPTSTPLLRSMNEASPERLGNRLRPIVNPKLPKDLLQVGLDGFLGYMHTFGDLTCRPAVAQLLKHS